MIGLGRAYWSSEFVNTTIRRLFWLAFLTRRRSVVLFAPLKVQSNNFKTVPCDRLSELMRYFNAAWMLMFKPDGWN